MKKTKFFYLIMCVISIYSCDKEVNITNPIILNSPFELYIYDTITLEMIVGVEIDGVNEEVDNYEWIVIDELGDSENLFSQNENSISWVPLRSGIHTVFCKVSAGNKSITEVKRYNVSWDYKVIRNLLKGDWQATGSTNDGTKWRSTFTFQGGSDYYATLDSIIYGNVISPFGKAGVDPVMEDPYSGISLGFDFEKGSVRGDLNYIYRNFPLEGGYYAGRAIFFNLKFNNDLDSFNMKAYIISGMNGFSNEAPHDTINYDFSKK